MRNLFPAAVEQFPVVRQSLLASFDNCELASFFEQSYGRGWYTHPQGRGQIFHRTAAECMREMMRNGEPTIDVDLALTIMHEQLMQKDIPHEDRVPVPANHRDELTMAVTKFARDNSWSIDKIVGIEERLHHELHYEVDGVRYPRAVTGQLDVLMIEGNDATVIDYKDTWAMPGPSDVSDAGFFQQRFYAMLVFAAYPSVRTVTLREFYPRYTESREATIDRAMMIDLEAEFAALLYRFDRAYQEHFDMQLMTPAERAAALAEAGTNTLRSPFVPSPGAHCSYCLTPEDCPIFPAARGAGAVTDLAAAERAGAQLLVSKSLVKKLTEALKAYVNQHGPVTIKDAKRRRQFRFVTTTRTARPTEEQIAAAIEESPDATPHQIQKIIASLYRTTKGTAFKDAEPERETDQ